MDSSPNTLFIGKVLHHFAELASTNSYASDILSKSKPSEGTVISTAHQPVGRGQIGRSWESEAGKNLTFSLILYPQFLPARRQFELSQAISLAVFDLVNDLVDHATYVKWPNDIYVEERKIAGILIQNTLSGANIQASIIGIGLNVNQTVFRSDAPNPTSLSLEMGQVYDLSAIFHRLCHKIEHRYLHLRSGEHNLLQNDYLRHLYRVEKAHFFQRISDQSVFQGVIKGVEASGKLRILIDGQEHSFGLQEIRFLP